MDSCCDDKGASGQRVGFTLIEMILVAALMAITVAIGAPYFVQSIRGNRLQMGARTVTLSARYARSMAVMRQQSFRLAGEIGGDTIAVTPAGIDRRDDDAWSLPAGPPAIEPPLPAPMPEPDSDAEPQPGAGIPSVDIQRQLDGVVIAAFRPAGDEWRYEGSYDILFYPNGTCAAFAMRLRERGDRELTIEVDELGAVRVTRD